MAQRGPPNSRTRNKRLAGPAAPTYLNRYVAADCQSPPPHFLSHRRTGTMQRSLQRHTCSAIYANPDGRCSEPCLCCALFCLPSWAWSKRLTFTMRPVMAPATTALSARLYIPGLLSQRSAVPLRLCIRRFSLSRQNPLHRRHCPFLFFTSVLRRRSKSRHSIRNNLL